MSRLKILMFIAVALSLGAGILLGFAGARMSFRGDHHGHSFLTEELNLTDDQRTQMEKIWSSTVNGLRDKHFAQIREMRQQQEKMFQDLLTPEQKAKYDAFNKDFAAKMAIIDKERDDSIQSAIDQTKKILTDSQRAKYEQILKDHPPPPMGGPGGPHGDHGPGGPPPDGPDGGFGPPPTSEHS